VNTPQRGQAPPHRGPPSGDEMPNCNARLRSRESRLRGGGCRSHRLRSRRILRPRLGAAAGRANELRRRFLRRRPARAEGRLPSGFRRTTVRLRFCTPCASRDSPPEGARSRKLAILRLHAQISSRIAEEILPTGTCCTTTGHRNERQGHGGSGARARHRLFCHNASSASNAATICSRSE
jgi:hypothetical protein